MRSPWTHEELVAMRERTRTKIEQTEEANPDARGLPPLTEDEARDLLRALIDKAAERALSQSECFLHGQLLAGYKMAIQAKMLDWPPGRYFVISEADIAKHAKAEEANKCR